MFKRLYYPGDDLTRDTRGRVYFYDNLRFVLIFLVVQRHFLFRIQDDYIIISGLYMFFLWFLMPLFVFVTGFYSKGTFAKNGSFRLGRIVNFVLLYLILDQVIYLSSWAASHVTGGKSELYANWDLTQMPGAQWYMFACAIWFFLIPALRKIPAAVAVPASVAIGVVTGYFNWADSFLAFVKIFGFLPFFVLGYYLTTGHFTPLLEAKAKWRIAALIFLLVFAIAVVVFREEFIGATKRFLEVKEPFEKMWRGHEAIGPGLWWLLRLAYYAGVFVVSLAVILAMPVCKTPWTAFGARTLQIYIIHCAVVRLIKPLGYYDFLDGFPPILRDVCLFASAVLLTFLLSPKFLGAPFNALAKLTDKLKITFG